MSYYLPVDPNQFFWNDSTFFKLRGSIIEGQEDLLFVHALTQEECLEAVASVFSIVHSSVANCSRRMLLTLKRYNYVTPTNYLELVEGYKR